jgi:hypothetical protein
MVQTSALKPEHLFVEIYKMEHVGLFMLEDTKAWSGEQKAIEANFNRIHDLMDVFRTANYYEYFWPYDIEEVKQKYKELQIVLAVCKNSKMLIDIIKN